MDSTLSADTPQPSHVEKRKRRQLVSELSHSKKNFFKKPNECTSKPAILSITIPYAHKYQPKTASACFPQPLPELYRSEYSDLDYLSLLDMCFAFEINVTTDMAKAVEEVTQDQSHSKL